MRRQKIQGSLTVSDTDELVREHRLDGIHILPGVAMLDAIYKTLASAGHSANTLKLKNILFHEPVVTQSAMDRSLTVTIELDTHGGQVHIRGRPVKDGVVSADATNDTLHLSCRILWCEPLSDTLLSTDMHDGEDLDTCYQVTRHVGIQHDEFMKCRGSVRFLSTGGCIARVSLGLRALQHQTDFQLHPVLLDCSTVVPMYGWHSHLEDAQLFIPFGIDEFQASSLQGHGEVFIQVDPSAGNDPDSELLRNSFTLFSIYGEPLVRFKHFTVKRVRSLENVRHLLTSGVSARHRKVEIAPLVTTSVDKSPLKVLIYAQVEQHGELTLEPSQETTPFFELGLDSLTLLDMAEALEARLGVQLYPTLLFEHASVSALTSYLNQTFPAEVAALDGGTVDSAHRSKGLNDLIFHLIEQSTSMQLNPERDGLTSFFELGIDSMALLDICETLSSELDIELYPTLLFEHKSVSALTEWLINEHPEAVGAITTGGESVSAPAVIPIPYTVPVQEQPQTYLPRWLPVKLRAHSSADSSGSRTALITAAEWSSPVQILRDSLNHDLVFELDLTSPADETLFTDAFGHGALFDHLWCIGIDHDDLFQLLKALVQTDRLSRLLQLNLITQRAFSVHGEAINAEAAHGVWGLLQTASREYPSLKVTQLDVSDPGSLSDLDTALFWTDEPRRLLAVRESRFYQRYLLPARHLDPAVTKWRSGGVYLIIGGSGGIGLALLRRLCERYGASVAIMGRRPLADLPEVQRAMERFGDRVCYQQGRVDNEVDLIDTLKEVQIRLGTLHGIVHAAMVLDDKRLTDMSQADFNRVLTPKVAGINALGRVLGDIELDFLLIFSSLQSFVGNVAQGNYAAASTYLDGQSLVLDQVLDVPVRVINWGVWSDVGAVATAVHRKLLTRQGMVGMATDRALDELDRALSAGWSQTVIAAVEPAVLLELGGLLELELLTRGETHKRIETQATTIAWDPRRWEAVKDTFAVTQAAMDSLMMLARGRLTSVLQELNITGPENLAGAPPVRDEFIPLLKALTNWLVVGPSTAVLTQVDFDAAVSELSQDAPTLEAFTGLLRDCLVAYPDILTGRVRASEVVFPQGSIEAVKAVYADNTVSGFYNDLVADQVVHLSIDLDRPIRILEIGAGTGATTQAVIEGLRLADKRVEYHYTELWDTLLHDAKDRLGQMYPNLKFDFLDINTDPRRQGFTDVYDVVIATNVLHATHQLATSLQHVKSLLRRGGRLILNESVGIQPYSTLTFGLLPGWWHAIDVEERLPHSPLVSRQRWCMLLRDAGFDAVTTVVPESAQGDSMAIQEVFVAISNGEARLVRSPSADAQTDKQLGPPNPSTVPKEFLVQLEPVSPQAMGINSIEAFNTLKIYRDSLHHLWLFMDNPPANTFTEQGLAELCQVLESIKVHPERLTGRLLYISHFGPYFSLGGDRTQIAQWVSEQNWQQLRAFADKARRLLVALSTMDAIVVGVVNGSAQGGGLETLLATDLQVVRNGVGMGLPEIKSGLLPGMGGMTYLKQQIGTAPLKRLLITGEQLSSEQAYTLGLVSHLAEKPFEAALALADQLDHLQTAILIKQRLNEGVGECLTSDIDYWLDYLSTHGDLIDLNRILNSEQILTRQSIVAPEPIT